MALMLIWAMALNTRCFTGLLFTVISYNIFGSNSLIQFMCILDHEKIVRFLIENGAEINANDIAEWTPLHTAAYRGG